MDYQTCSSRLLLIGLLWVSAIVYLAFCTCSSLILYKLMNFAKCLITTYLATVKLDSRSARLRAFGKKTAWQRLVSWVISQIPQTSRKGRKTAYLLSPMSPNAKVSFLHPLEKAESTGTFHHCCLCPAQGICILQPQQYYSCLQSVSK